MLWRNWKRSVSMGLLFAASFAAVVTVEQLRIERVRESAALELVRADWEAAGAVYKVDSSAMSNFLESRHCSFVLAGADGAPLQYSGVYREIGAPLPPASNATPRLWKFTAEHNPLRAGRYVFFTGVIRDRADKAYQLTVGRPL